VIWRNLYLDLRHRQTLVKWPAVCHLRKLLSHWVTKYRCRPCFVWTECAVVCDACAGCWQCYFSYWIILVLVLVTGWQVTLSDFLWHVFPIVVRHVANCYIQLLYFTLLYFTDIVSLAGWLVAASTVCMKWLSTTVLSSSDVCRNNSITSPTAAASSPGFTPSIPL